MARFISLKAKQEAFQMALFLREAKSIQDVGSILNVVSVLFFTLMVEVMVCIFYVFIVTFPLAELVLHKGIAVFE